MPELLGVEVLDRGTFITKSGKKVNILDRDIEEVKRNTDFLLNSNRLKPRLKLGHSSKQILDQSDGQPALGHVKNPRIVEGKLIADFVDIPQVLFSAIEKSLFTNVSTELEFSEEFGLYLDAVAILGVDLPAITSLNDLQTFLSKADVKKDPPNAKLNFSNCVINKPIDKRVSMTYEEMLAAIQKSNPTIDVEKLKEDLRAEFSKGNEFEDVTKENEGLKEQVRKLQFSQKETDFMAPYEKMVEEKKATPALVEKVKAHVEAQKLKFSKGEIEDLTPPVEILTWLDETKVTGKLSGTSLSKGKEKTAESPDVVIARETKILMPSCGGDYSRATELYFSKNPEVVADYKDLQIKQHHNQMYAVN